MKFTEVRQQIAGRLAKLEWISLLLTRVALAAVFAESGWGKLHNLPKVTEYFASLNIPAPQIQAPMVATFEFVCGVLVGVGFLTRLASLPIVAIMAVATLTAKLGDVSEWTDFFGFTEVLYILMALTLITRGAGCFSIDYLLTRKDRK